jgi:hypothetical protein
MVLARICIKAMVPAMAQLPEISQEIKNVAPEPVTRQVTVLIRLRQWLSFNYSYTVHDAHVSFAGHIPFLYAIFQGRFAPQRNPYFKVLY